MRVVSAPGRRLVGTPDGHNQGLEASVKANSSPNCWILACAVPRQADRGWPEGLTEDSN
jgi:hypothetical protein